MVEAAIALAVAAIPEGFPIVATLALARGMWRMARQNALIERLSAVETLGASIYKWKAKFGGMDVSEAKRLKTLEDENTRLKRLLADAMLDNAALKDLLGKKW
jgi:putative transposase